MSAKQNVAIVQPYIPDYRVPFFNGLREQLAGDGVELTLFYGEPTEQQAKRGDAAHLEWATQVPVRQLPLGRSRSLKHLAIPSTKPFDLVIVEQALANTQMWIQLAARFGSQRKVALWGHGSILTRDASRVEQAAIAQATKRGDWFFAYTEGVAEQLRRPMQGRVTNVNNVVDTREIRAHMSDSEESARRRPARRFFYMGGLDPSKGVVALTETFRRLNEGEADPIQLVVAGDGSDRACVESIATANPWLTYVGPLRSARDKVELSRGARALILPGRAGLAIVEAFALGMPVIAVSDARNAPETEYLEHGYNAHICRSDDLLNSILTLTRDDAYQQYLSTGAVESASALSIDKMVENFSRGIHRALEHRPATASVYA